MQERGARLELSETMMTELAAEAFTLRSSAGTSGDPCLHDRVSHRIIFSSKKDSKRRKTVHSRHTSTDSSFQQRFGG